MAELIAPDVLKLALETLPTSREAAPQPQASELEIGKYPGAALGIWELAEGSVREVEGNEVFIVLSGSGELVVEDGLTVSLGPGVMVRLDEGDRTTWTVTERLRKVYLAYL